MKVNAATLSNLEGINMLNSEQKMGYINSIIAERSSKQYENLENAGTMLKISEQFLQAAEIVATNASNVYLKHPMMPNVSILVFGRNTKHYFGVMLETEIITDSGVVVNVPQILSERRFCLKMGGSASHYGVVSCRGFVVSSLAADEKEAFGKGQIRMEEAIISIKKYGCIRPLRGADSPEKDFECHHDGYQFDLRRDNLKWVSHEDHRDIHKETSQKSHNRVMTVYPNCPIPAFVAK